MINKCDILSTATLLTPPEGQQPTRWAKYAVAFQPAYPPPLCFCRFPTTHAHTHTYGTHSRPEIHKQKIDINQYYSKTVFLVFLVWDAKCVACISSTFLLNYFKSVTYIFGIFFCTCFNRSNLYFGG